MQIAVVVSKTMIIIFVFNIMTRRYYLKFDVMGFCNEHAASFEMLIVNICLMRNQVNDSDGVCRISLIIGYFVQVAINEFRFKLYVLRRMLNSPDIGSFIPSAGTIRINFQMP